MRRHNLPAIIILILLAIGLVTAIFHFITALIIPIAVFGIVYYLYKHPPRRYRSRSSQTGNPRDVKKAKFRVIEGYKRDHHDDDMPKYH